MRWARKKHNRHNERPKARKDPDAMDVDQGAMKAMMNGQYNKDQWHGGDLDAFGKGGKVGMKGGKNGFKGNPKGGGFYGNPKGGEKVERVLGIHFGDRVITVD